MTELACPFCGDPHPAGDDEDPDFVDEPGCEHWIGRRDPDAGLEGALDFLEGLEFDPWEPSEDVDPWERPSEPDADALQAAFGAYRHVAVATYSDGFAAEANGVQLLEALIDQLGIRELQISGDSLMGWTYYDYYAGDSDKALASIKRAAAALQAGIASLNGSSPSD